MRFFINGAASVAEWMQPMLSEMKAITEENKQLKRMYAESQLQNELLKEALGKKVVNHLTAQDDSAVGGTEQVCSYRFGLCNVWHL